MTCCDVCEHAAVRWATVGVAGRNTRRVGIRLPKAVRRIEEEDAGTLT